MWESVLMAMVAVALAGMLLSLGFWLGTRSSRSASVAASAVSAVTLEAARQTSETNLTAAKAVSDMTVTLADEVNRQADLAGSLILMREQVTEQTAALRQMADRLQLQVDNTTILTEAFIQRGFLRAARVPAQTGERRRPGPPPSVPSAQGETSPSPTELISTG